MASPTARFTSSGDDIAVFQVVWPGGALPSVSFVAPTGETRPVEFFISDGPTTDSASYIASDTLANTGNAAVTSGLNTFSFGGTVVAAGTYDLQVDIGPPDGVMRNAVAIGAYVADKLNGIVGGYTTLDLVWSATADVALSTTSVLTDDEDAWSVPLEWSCLVDLEPPDDVEGDP